LRVAGPFDFTRDLTPILAAFLTAHPAVRLELRLSNRTLDMVDEGIDVYLRITNRLDAESVARPLAISRIAMWRAPS
jgi:DNA-binding transcriptional LysR family regulator